MLILEEKNTYLLNLFFWITVFLLTFASFSFSVEEELDLDIILAGIKHYDSLVKSGEGKVSYKRVQTPGLTDDGHRIAVEYHLAFTQLQTRMDIPEYFIGNTHFPKLTFIETKGEGELHLPEDKSPVSYLAYHSFPTKTFIHWHPKRIMTTEWVEGSLYEHLKEKEFQIKQKQTLKEVECYILENTDGEKIWIAPQQGFRFLKYEHRFPLKKTLQRGLIQGAPIVSRKNVSYENHGEAWFPKQINIQTFFINKKGEEELFLKTDIETKDFRVNHDISEKTFATEIPDTAQIWVGDLKKHISKKEFFDVYKLEWVK